MKVIALRRAFYRGAIVRVGDVINTKGNLIPEWAKKFDEKEEVKEPQQPQQPQQPQPEQPQVNQNAEQINLGFEENGKGKEEEKQEDKKEEEKEPQQPQESENLEEKTDEELMEILNPLLDTSVQMGIMLENAADLSLAEQIVELRKLIKENKKD